MERRAETGRPWWRGVGESALLLGILTLAGWAVGAAPGFRGISPNPYVIVVCLMALRYGLRDGLLSAGQATGWLLAMAGVAGLGPSPLPLEIRAFLWDTLVLGGAGLLLGYLADEHLTREAKLVEQTRQLSEELGGIREQVAVLEEANRELVKRITSETQTIGSLYGMAEKLSVLDLKDLYPGILDLVAEYVGAEKCTLYLVEGDHLVAAGHRGWEGAPADRPTIPLPDGVMGRVVRERLTLSLRDLAIGGTPPPDQWVMATPIVDPEMDRPIGALVVEQLPFQRLNRSNVRVFSVIGKWAGMAIRQAATYSTAVTEKARADAAMNRLLDGLKTRPGSRHAIPALVEMGEPVIPLLAGVLQTGLPRQRFHALEALEKLRVLGHPPPAEAVQNLIGHELGKLVRLLRFSAALADVKIPTFDALRWTLEEEQARTVDTLLLAEAMREDVPLRAATEHWQSRNPGLHQRAVAAIRGMPSTPATRVILALCDGGPAAALAAHDGEAASLPQPEAVPAILLREDEDPWLLAGALYAAPACSDPHIVDLVLPRVEHADPLLRENALAALAELACQVSDDRIVTRLTAALNDPLPAIRALAASSLAAISPESEKPTLVVTFLTGPFQGQQRRFDRFPVAVGRAPENDLAVAYDDQISRVHVRVSRDVRGFVLEDMGSRNGTFLEDVRLMAPLLLSSAKVIRIGRTQLHLAPTAPVRATGQPRPTPAEARGVPILPEVASQVEAVLVLGLCHAAEIAQRDGEAFARRLRDALRMHVRLGCAEAGMLSFKEIGDGYMATFPAVKGALRAAVGILREKGEALPPRKDGRVPSLRIGIHVGETRMDAGGTRHGDTVILARQLEAAGPAGFQETLGGIARASLPVGDRIFLSEESYRDTRDTAQYPCRLVGYFDCEGIPGPQRAYEVLWRQVQAEGAAVV